MWLVVAIAVGLLALSLFFAGRIQRLKVYTVAQMLRLRYGVDATVVVRHRDGGLHTDAVGDLDHRLRHVFNVLFGTDRTLSVIIGGAIVMLYSSIGGMWSITLTDMVQFILKTIGSLLPAAARSRGSRPAASTASWSARLRHGTSTSARSEYDTIVTFFVVYTFGMLIGQDIWQRVFTARSPGVAKWGGTDGGALLRALRRRRRC